MVEIKIDEKQYRLKSSFTEFTEKELKIVCYLRSQNMNIEELDQIKFNAVRITLFKLLSNVPMSLIERITAVQWVDILPHMNFVFKAPDFKTNPFPRLRIGANTYIGPSGMLDKSTVEEMSQADTAFIASSNGKEEDKLYLLAAILYRPQREDLAEFKKSKEWNNDIREPFNIEKCKARVNEFKKLRSFYVIAVYLYYFSFRENKLMKFTRVFKKATEKQSDTGTNRGWAGTLLEMAHLPVFGNIDQLIHQNWFTVVYEMDRQLEIKENQEKEIERQRMHSAAQNRR
jgi:hypothetical protein